MKICFFGSFFIVLWYSAKMEMYSFDRILNTVLFDFLYRFYFVLDSIEFWLNSILNKQLI